MHTYIRTHLYHVYKHYQCSQQYAHIYTPTHTHICMQAHRRLAQKQNLLLLHFEIIQKRNASLLLHFFSIEFAPLHLQLAVYCREFVLQLFAVSEVPFCAKSCGIQSQRLVAVGKGHPVSYDCVVP